MSKDTDIEELAIKTLEKLNTLPEKKLTNQICNSLYKINEENLCIPGTITSYNNKLNNKEGFCDSCMATFFLDEFCK